ncbi:outer membrane beta-barrel protein [Changchengzhania lutea]|uniref:outer membrane beta-barrel protein n=1 Tax=Changchengzhania lutea TaxID=2049305 RepID=UPI00115F6904|nr:outer membrane beta-barrel protein [Changchengzhania lutea]
MKKLFLLSTFVIFAFGNVNAQGAGFGVKAGYNAVSFDFGGASVSEGGFFVGLGYEFDLSESIDLEPSLLYSSVKDLSSLYIPVMFKYNLSEEFNIQAGPQVNYILEDEFDEAAFGLDIAVGAGYDITEDFFAEARYGFQVSRDLEGVDVNTFTIGVGYRF